MGSAINYDRAQVLRNIVIENFVHPINVYGWSDLIVVFSIDEQSRVLHSPERLARIISHVSGIEAKESEVSQVSDGHTQVYHF